MAPAKTAVRKPPAKKAAPAKAAPAAAAKPVKEPKEKAPRTPKAPTRGTNKELVAKIIKMRDDEGKKWDEIGNAVGLSVGRAQAEYFIGKTPKPETATPEKIVKARTVDLLSWAKIAARFGITESHARQIFRSTGESDKGNRIGRGGRYPNGVERPPRPEKVAKAPGQKRSAGFKDPALTNDSEFDAVKATIAGRTIQHKNGNTVEEIKVGENVKVGRSKAGKIGASFIQNDGSKKTRSVFVENIVGVK